MRPETLNVLQSVGVVASLLFGAVALVLSWQNNRATNREADVAAEQLRASIIPVPMIEDSRLTWRGRHLVVLALRLRNVGSGPILGLRITAIRLDRSGLEFEELNSPKADVVRPTVDVEQRLRFGPPPEIPASGLLVIEVAYLDVLGNSYQHPLTLAVTAGSGSGAMAGVRPARVTRNR